MKPGRTGPKPPSHTLSTSGGIAAGLGQRSGDTHSCPDFLNNFGSENTLLRTTSYLIHKVMPLVCP